MLPKKSEKKKMADITWSVPIRQTLKKAEIKKLEEDFKKIDKQIEQFEKEETERFQKEEAEKRAAKKIRPQIYILLGALLVLLAVIIYSAIEILPRAEIKIITKKTEWRYIDSVSAAKNITKSDSAQKQIPAEVFSLRKNFNFSFPASGKKQVEQKAGGKIIIYNAYSSDPQVLVANTRFLSPDGKTFRLTQKITVPGAKISEGKIIPSSIEATVIADQPGPQYNIGPVSRFSIPGFQGSAKYQGFYAESKEPMKAGFIGEMAFPTDEDIKQAKEKVRKDLKDYIDSFLSLQIPPEFKIIDGSKQFSILKEEINKEVDEKGNFAVFLEGESSIIAFKESDLKNLMEELAKIDLGASFELKDYKLEYGAGRADFKAGRISFSVNFSGVFEQPINIDDFKQNALGKNEENLRNLVYSLSDIEKTTISFWPFWVKRVPDDLKRVKVWVE